MRRSDHLPIELRPAGLYCPAGDFYVDPWRPVERAVVTHAHADHARPGHERYLCATAAAGAMRVRLGEIRLQTLDYGEPLVVGRARLSLHPAGHVLGSAQVSIEIDGHRKVLSGDYKLQADPTCAPFEPLRCDLFVTESTFGLPIYRWLDSATVIDEIRRWWHDNAAAGLASVIFVYAFGKAQRLLAGLAEGPGPLVCHGAVEALNRVYRAGGVTLPPTRAADDGIDRAALRRALVLAPPSAAGSPWLKRFAPYADAFASGWMQVRGQRRRRALDRGFVLSDHADWPALLQAIDATGAETLRITHGHVDVMVRWLREQGLDAGAFETAYGEQPGDDG